jgi:hypothetical protein
MGAHHLSPLFTLLTEWVLPPVRMSLWILQLERTMNNHSSPSTNPQLRNHAFDEINGCVPSSIQSPSLYPYMMVTILLELRSVEIHSVLILLLFHKIPRLTKLCHFLLKRFHHPIQLLKDFWPNKLVSSLLNLTSMRRLQPLPPFEHFIGSIPSNISLTN